MSVSFPWPWHRFVCRTRIAGASNGEQNEETGWWCLLSNVKGCSKSETSYSHGTPLHVQFGSSPLAGDSYYLAFLGLPKSNYSHWWDYTTKNIWKAYLGWIIRKCSPPMRPVRAASCTGSFSNLPVSISSSPTSSSTITLKFSAWKNVFVADFLYNHNLCLKTTMKCPRRLHQKLRDKHWEHDQ